MTTPIRLKMKPSHFMDPDLMQMVEGVKVLDCGEVTLLDVMGSDQDIVDAARVYRPSEKSPKGLINHLMQARHTSPFEMAEIKLFLKMPIFVARQWIRHRTASLNEHSGRYSEMPEEFHVPEGGQWRGQSKVNKQCSAGTVDYRPMLIAIGQDQSETNPDGSPDLMSVEQIAHLEYQRRLVAGVSREQARECLPISTYTSFVWKVDLHNLLHFLKLRLAWDAQPEIRVYAVEIEKMVAKLFPETHAAWVEFVRDAVTLPASEAAWLRRQGMSTPPHDGVSILLFPKGDSSPSYLAYYDEISRSYHGVADQRLVLNVNDGWDPAAYWMKLPTKGI